MPILSAYARWSGFRLLIIAALVGFTSGCSFAFVHGPPDGYEQMDSFSCSDGSIFPMLDLVGVGASVLNAVGAAQPDAGGWGDEEVQIFAATAGIAFAASAVTGYRRVSRCKAALEELARRSNELARALSPED